VSDSKKFLFDLNKFDVPDDDEPDIVEEEIEVEPPPPMFSEDELEAAKVMAQAAGRSEGLREERAKREQFIAETLQKISDSFETLFAAETYREKQYEEESLKLALEIIHRLSPTLRDHLGKEDLKRSLRDVLEAQSGQAEIKIEVHPDSARVINEYVDKIWQNDDHAPICKIVASNDLEPGACRLSWKDGGMVRDPSETARIMEERVKGLLSGGDKSEKPREKEDKESADVTPDENSVIKESGGNSMPQPPLKGDEQ
jgi:flagellar assembly protein FliH